MTAEDIPISPVSAITNISASETVVNPSSNQATPRPEHIAYFGAESARSSLPSHDNPAEKNQLKQPDIHSIGESAQGQAQSKESEISFNDEPIQGWPRLALLMAKNPDLAAFSRFRDLNVKSLLYYQAQLTLLRKKLHDLEYEDSPRNSESPWAERADGLVESDSIQFRTVKEMRSVLKEYSKQF